MPAAEGAGAPPCVHMLYEMRQTVDCMYRRMEEGCFRSRMRTEVALTFRERQTSMELRCAVCRVVEGGVGGAAKCGGSSRAGEGGTPA